MIGEITYNYTPNDWDQKRFLELGGFTVVFLNYNKAKFIEKSVASALKQDYPLLEMFFMDDASTDGSGDTMERLVREYSGRHKVTVVRNSENQYITGQWNIVAKLATGNWLGMFCGDDIAYPNRVRMAAQRIEEFPTLKGLCMNGMKQAVDSGELLDTIFPDRTVRLVTGGDLYANIARSTDIIGATAFWHKSLFDIKLPKGPLDDVLLHYVLCCKNQPSTDPIWLCDGESLAIAYGIGCGITNCITPNAGPLSGMTKRDKWLAAKMAIRRYERIECDTWCAIGTINRRFGKSARNVAELRRLLSHIGCGNTISRILDLPLMVLLSCTWNGGGAPLGKLWMKWGKQFIQELFGLKFAAFGSVMIHG